MKTIEKPILSNIHIMEYLIRKLESKEKKVKKINEKIKEENFKDYFLKNNNEITQIFIDLENDLLQAICAVKALLSENKSLIMVLSQNNIKNNFKKDLNIDVKKKNLNHKYLNSEPNYNIKTQLTPVKEENDDYGNKKNQLSEVKTIINNIKENKKKLKKAIEVHFLNNNKNNKYNIIDNSNSCNNHNILMKVIKDQDNFNLLHKKLGNNFMSKILDKNCSKEYLENINKLIC
jgi:hypothetical protein